MEIIFLLLLFPISVDYAQSEEEESIIALLEKESATWCSGDVKSPFRLLVNKAI
tara:strand:- start:178 stop:339 length:162 start_codon:yes stop_codon:yes gene_type:complete